MVTFGLFIFLAYYLFIRYSISMDSLVIHAISDTHNRHAELELKGGDILIHAGDVSGRGTPEEIISFLNWFEQQDYSNLILIPGNHDFDMEKNFFYYAEECKKRNIMLLNDSGIVVKG